MEVPEYIEPIIGWRIWSIINGDLCSVHYKSNTWEPGKPIKATCLGAANYGVIPVKRLHPELPAPKKNCNCGIYGASTKEYILKYFSNYGRTSAEWVLGTVKLWGKIVECEWGWRAEYGYPASLEPYDPAETEALYDVRNRFQL